MAKITIYVDVKESDEEGNMLDVDAAITATIELAVAHIIDQFTKSLKQHPFVEDVEWCFEEEGEEE